MKCDADLPQLCVKLKISERKMIQMNIVDPKNDPSTWSTVDYFTSNALYTLSTNISIAQGRPSTERGSGDDVHSNCQVRHCSWGDSNENLAGIKPGNAKNNIMEIF